MFTSYKTFTGKLKPIIVVQARTKANLQWKLNRFAAKGYQVQGNAMVKGIFTKTWTQTMQLAIQGSPASA